MTVPAYAIPFIIALGFGAGSLTSTAIMKNAFDGAMEHIDQALDQVEAERTLCEATASAQGLKTARVRLEAGQCQVKVFGQGWSDLASFAKSEVVK